MKTTPRMDKDEKTIKGGINMIASRAGWDAARHFLAPLPSFVQIKQNFFYLITCLILSVWEKSITY